MQLIALYMGMLALGYFIASKLRSYKNSLTFISKPMMLIIYALVFVMGAKMGINEQVTSNLGTIGIQALIITVFCVGGSMLAIFASRKIMHMDRYGNLRSALPVQAEAGSRHHQSGCCSECSSDTKLEKQYAAYPKTVSQERISIQNKKEPPISEKHSSSDLQNTIIILALVAIGMLIGCYIIADFPQQQLSTFESFSSTLMVVMLACLLGLVGFDMGLSGGIFSDVKKAGIKIVIFPIAAVIGTLIFGALASMFFGFSLKEGLAISAGFGWYTYAPTVIADAGSQHIVASAVSFMHNVIRETAGIVLIPVAAKYFGYIEATSLPGVAAMDVCMPIVERSCRKDTVVYSFTTGFAMNIGASILVPFFMSLNI